MLLGFPDQSWPKIALDVNGRQYRPARQKPFDCRWRVHGGKPMDCIGHFLGDPFGTRCRRCRDQYLNLRRLMEVFHQRSDLFDLAKAGRMKPNNVLLCIRSILPQTFGKTLWVRAHTTVEISADHRDRVRQTKSPKHPSMQYERSSVGLHLAVGKPFRP